MFFFKSGLSLFYSFQLPTIIYYLCFYYFQLGKHGLLFDNSSISRLSGHLVCWSCCLLLLMPCVCVCTWLYLWAEHCMQKYMCAYMYVCIYVCIYMYTHTHHIVGLKFYSYRTNFRPRIMISFSKRIFVCFFQGAGGITTPYFNPGLTT